MRKKLVFILLCVALNLQASQLVNNIVAIVESEPITLFEVLQAKQKLNINDKDALNLLIRDRLEQAQIKNLGLTITPYELNERINMIATKNNMTTLELKSQIEASGANFADFRADIEKKMLQEKLYKNIATDAGKNVNDERANAYYQANSAQFVAFLNANVILFRTKDAKLLEKQKGKTKAIKGVTSQNLSLSSSEIDPRLAVIIANTPKGEYTQTLRNDGGFDMFYIKEISGKYTPSFEQVKDQILNILYQSEQENLLRDYFDKLRAKAKIQILN